MSREYTTEEIQDHFLTYLRRLVDSWEQYPGSDREKMEGLVFTILVLFDGESADLPAWILAADPRQSDQNYCVERGENWFPDNTAAANRIRGDIADGTLHEKWLAKKETP